MALRALAGEVPHALFEARLAEAEVLVARGATGAAGVIRRSLELATTEGHLRSARRLRELLDLTGSGSRAPRPPRSASLSQLCSPLVKTPGMVGRRASGSATGAISRSTSRSRRAIASASWSIRSSPALGR